MKHRLKNNTQSAGIRSIQYQWKLIAMDKFTVSIHCLMDRIVREDTLAE